MARQLRGRVAATTAPRSLTRVPATARAVAPPKPGHSHGYPEEAADLPNLLPGRDRLKQSPFYRGDIRGLRCRNVRSTTCISVILH